MVANTKTTEEKQRAEQKRRPFGVPVSRLGVQYEIDGYHLRWINDEPGRIAQAEQGGYEFVAPEEVGRDARDDNKVKELVGVQRDEKTPMFAYLMKIRMDWYLEDKKLRDQSQEKFDDAIRKGQLERQPGDNRYIPEGGIVYKTK